MRNWLMRWVASTLALLVIIGAYSIVHTPNGPGISVDTPVAFGFAVVALGLANSVIRPIIMLFAWPINCLTFGLFSFALNVLLFLAVGNLNFGFHVKTPLDALIGSVAMGVLSGMINLFLTDGGGKGGRKRD